MHGRRAAALALAAGAWAAIVFAAFRPGLMSIDALVHYGQGLQHAYSNQHPPLVAVLFGLSGWSFGTPAGILALQLGTIGGGFALLSWRGLRDGPRPLPSLLVLAVFLAAPTTWTFAAMLGKDGLMAGALLLACAALRSGRPGATLALALAGTLLRHNAILAAAPLAVGAIWEGRRPSGRLARGAVAAVAVAVLAAAPAAVERATRARDVWPLGQLLAYDLAGIYVRHPEALPASTLARDLSVADLRRLYTPFTGGPLIFPRHPGDPGIPFDGLAARRDELTAEWLRAVRTYPRAWLAHRWDVFRALLGTQRGPAFYPFHATLDPNPWGLRLHPGSLSRALEAVRDGARDGIAFRGWFWIGLSALATAVAARRARRDGVPLWIALSGLAYALAYLAVSVSAEFRYLYWTALSTFATAAAALGTGAAARVEVSPRAARAGAAGAPSAAPPTATARRRSGPAAPRSAERPGDR
ncbi:hypothetical protein [Anaeromyxobacter oryzae]|uniref:Glycosyltransferase RgtA/B/C/D-like domain-containing protein n=1 Tax=Anaeromyxobacter oryzae TaxID=2918170 RepID=A0ABM7WQJ8_9BACT|nr:hypothetical protein [Anaeromyxobacter oryzae]BDG01733.1 hypothetical protein AMOR_07290 [Anaeromyxobacter oryzae]